MSVNGIFDLLSRHRMPASNDAELKEAVAMVLRERGVPFLREFVLSDRDHVDFLCGTVAIECKAQGSALALAQQLARLQNAAEISSLIVVVTRERLIAIQDWVPSSFTKPLHMLVTRA